MVDFGSIMSFEHPMGDDTWAATMGELNHPRMLGWPGFALSSVDRGTAVLRCEVNEASGGGAGSSGGMHGGVLASLLDCAGTLAAISSMHAGQEGRGTMNLEISYLRPGAGAWGAH